MNRKGVMSATSTGQPRAFSSEDSNRELRPSYYFLEPLPSLLEPSRFPCGWRVRFIGQYDDTNEDVELGGGNFWGNTTEETQNAYDEARSRGEAWTRHGGHFIPVDGNTEAFPEQLETLVNQRLLRSRCVRSDEYRLGMLDVLRSQSDGSWIPFRFPAGTAQSDAYDAGRAEGYALWQEVATRKKTVIEGPAPSVKPKRRLSGAGTAGGQRPETSGS